MVTIVVVVLAAIINFTYMLGCAACCFPGGTANWLKLFALFAFQAQQ
jgi:hypothetical protein